MSDEPKKRSPTIRLAVSMVLGVFAGAVFIPLVGGRIYPLAPLICAASGALAGLAVECSRRFLESPAHAACWGDARETRSATLNSWTGWGMLVGALCGFNAALTLGNPPGAKELLALSLFSIAGTVVGGVLGLLTGMGRSLFLTGGTSESGQAGNSGETVGTPLE